MHTKWVIGFMLAAAAVSGCRSKSNGKGGGGEDPVNEVPVAAAGADQDVRLRATVILDGTGSTDADVDDVLTYEWTLISVPDGSAATLSDAAAASPTFVADREGRYVAGLVVSDGKAASPLATVEIDAALRVAVYGDYYEPLLTEALRYVPLETDGYADIHSTQPRVGDEYVIWREYRGELAVLLARELASGTVQVVVELPSDLGSLELCGSHAVFSTFLDEEGDPDSDVFLADLVTGEVLNLSDDDSEDFFPNCAGDLVVWTAYAAPLYEGDIEAYRISTAARSTIASGAEADERPVTDGTWVAWNRGDVDSDLFAADASQAGMPVPIVVGSSGQIVAGISGGILAWRDSRSGDWDPYLIDLDGGTELRLESGNGNTFHMRIDGDVAVYGNEANAGDIYGWRISTGTPITIEDGASIAMEPFVRGDWVVWMDDRDPATFGADVYARNLVTGVTSAITEGDNDEAYAQVNASGLVVWSDDSSGVYDIHASDDQGETSTVFSSDKPRLGNSIDDYNVVLIGDYLDTTAALAIFDAADAAGVPLVSIGTAWNYYPLSGVLYDEGRLGIETNYTCCGDAMHVVLGTAEHPIFAGIAEPEETLWFGSDYNEGDEQNFTFDPTAEDAPASVNVLARFGDDMNFAGDPAIVEIVTQNGTRMIFDGSANTYDEHAYWNLARWTVLERELRYLAENPTE